MHSAPIPYSMTFMGSSRQMNPAPISSNFMAYDDMDSEGIPDFPPSPSDWIKQFVHNDTHVNIAMDNATLSLLWLDALVSWNNILSRLKLLTLNLVLFFLIILKYCTF